MRRLARIVNEVEYLGVMLDAFLQFARPPRMQQTAVGLNRFLGDLLDFDAPEIEQRKIEVVRDFAEDLYPVMLDRQQIKQVLLNLLLNALEAMRDTAGKLSIRTHRLVKPTGQEWVQVEVADTGPGIDQANLDHIFDPFYTTKHESGDREGTGLGLAIVHQIVQEHQGTLDVQSAAGKGTTVLVNLPATSKGTELSSLREEHEQTGPVSR